MGIYDEFATIYDELMNDFDYELWFNYIKEIWARYGKEPKSILEMACGTGSLTYEIAKAGYRTTCFDLSDNMLAMAYKKLHRFRNVRLLNMDMRSFKLDGKYDSIISICDSINYITSEDDLLDTFKNVWNHLEDDGIFIFDINSYYKLKHIIGHNNFIEDREDIFYTWQNYYDEEEDICEFYLTFFYRDDSKGFMRFDEVHMEKAYKTEKVLDLLNKAGFSRVDILESFTFNQPSEKTERINFIALKE